MCKDIAQLLCCCPAFFISLLSALLLHVGREDTAWKHFAPNDITQIPPVTNTSSYKLFSLPFPRPRIRHVFSVTFKMSPC